MNILDTTELTKLITETVGLPEIEVTEEHLIIEELENSEPSPFLVVVPDTIDETEPPTVVIPNSNTTEPV